MVQTKIQCWNGEEIHRCNHFAVIRQEHFPSLCRFRVFGRTLNPAQYGSFRDFETELKQFTVDTRCARVGLSSTIWKMSSRNSRLILFRPRWRECEIQLQ
jgi:hypothetical protein